MAIYFNKSKQLFHLQGRDMSYMLQIKEGYVEHLYWGNKLAPDTPSQPACDQNRPYSVQTESSFSLDTLPQEYPAYGTGDFRHPAYQVMLENGTTISDLRYKSHSIFKGKPSLEGLPATYVENEDEAETLEIILEDALTKLEAVLSYTAYNHLNVLTRHVRFYNQGQQILQLRRALSMSVDFPHADYDVLHLSGAWARERYVKRRSLTAGTVAIESRRGASSHQHNPFMALLGREATEDHGEVFGFNLVYSGNFVAQAEVDHYQTTRVSMGINPFDFTWILEPGQSFCTPEAVLVYSAEGLGAMSRTFHQLYRTRLCRGTYRDQERPILINNWEATYFDFDESKLKKLAQTAREMGIELFVLDDGWFGKRNDDTSSLGDWYVNREKLPSGLEGLATAMGQLGLKFGLWVEPEMISPDSDLYRQHPDWCLHVPNRKRSLGRHQLILDLSRQDVCDYLLATLTEILSSGPIAYVKWDMNRHMTEVGSAVSPAERQREVAHRYMLGLYRLLDELTRRFPHVLFESCSGGGGRFDPGILYYMPQTWTSDNTDAISRLFIQYGTSIVYPAISIGAHVSAVPNHQVGRITPLITRGHVAMGGNFGYELDLTQLGNEDKSLIRAQIALYKQIRPLVQFGELYRLISPFETKNEAAWMFVSPDKNDAVVTYVQILAEANPPLKRLRLKGLDERAKYEVLETGQIIGGDELMYMGLNLPELHGDFQSVLWRLKRMP